MFLLFACAPAPVGAVHVPADPDAPAQVGTPSVPEAQVLFLNEVMAKNESTYMAADATFPDWVELYATEAIDLSRVTITGAGEDWVGSGSLAAGTHLVVSPLTLSAEGERLELRVDGDVVDRIDTGPLDADVAWARFPDGGDWSPTAHGTPGTTNILSASTDPSDALFETILDFELTLPEASIASLRASPYTEVPASLGFQSIWFREVSVRIKGVYGSLRSLDQKTAFVIDLDEYSNHRLRGLEQLTLNNMVQDPTYIHEFLAFRLFRAAGVPAPRTGWARLTVNGTYYGLYAFIEPVDDTFLARWYDDANGNLYEGSYGVDFYSGYENYFECDECAHPQDRTDLTAVIDILNESPTDEAVARLETRVDLDQFLTELAVESIVWHWDGYTTANNYRIYHDPVSDRFSLIPWGADQTFVDDWYGPWDGYGRVFTWCLANAACAERYDDRLLVVADLWDTLAMEGEARRWLRTLADDIAADPRREWSDSARNREIDATFARIALGAEEIRAAVNARR